MLNDILADSTNTPPFVSINSYPLWALGQNKHDIVRKSKAIKYGRTNYKRRLQPHLQGLKLTRKAYSISSR